MERIRKPRSSNSEKQLAALKKAQAPKPADAPTDGALPTTIGFTLYPEALANLADLVEASGASSRSHLVRMVLAYAAANKEEFLEWGKSGVQQKTTPPN
jgi:hypothetical protein